MLWAWGACVVSSFFGTKFSRKQLKIPMSSNKHLPSKFNCGFARSSSAWTNKQRQKNTRQDLTTNTEGKKNKIKDKKPYVLSVLRHIFVIFSSQISTVMETSDAILEYETTNWRWENNPRDIRFQSSLLLSMIFLTILKNTCRFATFPYIRVPQTAAKTQSKDSFFKSAPLIPTASTNAFHTINLFLFFALPSFHQ